LTNTPDPLLRSLVPVDRIGQAPDDDGGQAATRIVTEPRLVTGGGMVASHGARVLSAVEVLHRRQALTERQAKAGHRLLLSYQFGVLGVRQAARGCSAWAPGGILDSQLAALADYRTCRRAIGHRLWAVVCPVVCGDLAVAVVARQQQRNASAVMELLRLGLDVAGDHYGYP